MKKQLLNFLFIFAGIATGSIIYKCVNNKIKKNKKECEKDVIKCFISTPMTGFTSNEIMHNIFLAKADAFKILRKNHPDAIIRFIDSYNPDISYNNIKLLGIALEKLSECDYIYFTKGWSKSRGCIVENVVAKSYNIPSLYEK